MSQKCQERTKDNALPDVTYARPKPDRAVGRLYFVWVPSHATRLAEFVGIGRGVDLNIYIWIVISLLLLLNLHLKLRAHMELITVLARELAIANARSHRSTS
jgi:small membrane protein